MKKLDAYAARWEQIARDQPYFAVLADGDDGDDVESSRIANDAFFKTGEDDIAALLAAITSLFSREVSLDSVLDFGCGAGRLTLPLARRAGHVFACDIAPTILSHVRQNAERAGLGNVTFGSYDDIAATGPSFDFVCSLLVFQYIPASIGYALIQSLTELLRSGGIAALQLRIHGESRLQRLTSLSRRRREVGYGPAASTADSGSVLQTYRYDERLVARAVERAGGSVVALLPSHDRADGAVLIVRKL